MTDYEKILNSGKIYNVWTLTGSDTNYQDDLQKMEKYNSLGYTKEAEKEKHLILKELLAEIGEGSYIQAPYHAMCAGRHVHLGKKVYINFNCTFVDDANIYIGDHTMIAPNVTLISASHPISPKLRREGYGCNKPIYISENVWLASNVTVLPGVHIGNNSVIGAGSVVTKDIPANVIAIGTPAKVVREITPDDDIYYDNGKLISENIIE